MMVGPGLLLGVAGALAASRIIGSLLFEVEPTDPATIAGMTGVLALVALAAGAIPAWRAAHVDPVRALRGE
jgi:ABC-type antimicrobial peptide transport system permease subunit